MRQAALAAGVAVAAVSYSRQNSTSSFCRSVLTEGEVSDALIFAGATLVVLPLVPDRPIGPYGALNPHTIRIIVILAMAISAVATSIACSVLDLISIAGLASGLVSSRHHRCHGRSATKEPEVLAAMAGAVLLSLHDSHWPLLGAPSVITLRALSGSLISAGFVAPSYGLFFTIRALHQKTEGEHQPDKPSAPIRLSDSR